MNRNPVDGGGPSNVKLEQYSAQKVPAQSFENSIDHQQKVEVEGVEL